METFQYINANYNNDKTITIHAFDGKQIRDLTVVGFDPYFYVPIDEPIPDDPDIIRIEEGYRHEDGFGVKKIYTSSPNVIHSKKKSLRDKFSEHFEADVPFIRRFMIDLGITSGFCVRGSNVSRVSYKDIMPCEVDYKLNICYTDFEEDVTTRFVDPDNPINKVTGWTNYFTKEGIYYTCILDNGTVQFEHGQDRKVVRQDDTHIIIYVRFETDLLALFDSNLKSKCPQVIAYWNGEIADHKYPVARAKALGVKIEYERYDEIDLCQGYEIRFKKLYYRLKDVAVDEGIYTTQDLVAEEFHKDMWREDLDLFTRYNIMDVDILVQLDFLGWEHYDDIKEETKKEPAREIAIDVWGIKTYVGLEDARATFFNSVSIDTFHLRKAKENKIVLNSSPHGTGEKYAGALIFAPPPGVYENLKTVDMSRYYPNIILAYEIDPLAVLVVQELNKKRDEYEEKLEDIKKRLGTESSAYKAMKKRRDAVKFLLNSTYGYYGSPRSRKYKREKAGKITGKAKLGLQVLIRAMECLTPEELEKFNKYTKLNKDKGLPVLYGHTDSMMIQCDDNEIESIVYYLNEVVLREHAENEGVPPLLRLKHEKSAVRGLFVEAKGKSGISANAHYALLINWEEGKETDDIIIVGFDYVRGNTSPIGRKVQYETIVAILRGKSKELIPVIQKIKRKTENGEYPLEKVAIPINIKNNLEDYTKSNPWHVKAAKWSRDNLGLEIIAGDRVKLIPVDRVVGKDQTEWIAFFDIENLNGLDVKINYKRIVEKTIKSKIEQFLALVNISWRDIEGHTSFGDW